MNTLNPYQAFASQEQALVPGPSMIDGRTEKDRLRFLAEFATLLNFYDKDNRLNGNWAPFLLKDPAFLLATIGGTDFQKAHSLYHITCKYLHSILSEEAADDRRAFYFNHLFDQLTAVFLRIAYWVHFMQRSESEYDLKTYVIYQVKNNFSRYFWAIISLRQNLFLAKTIEGINPVDTSLFYPFDAFDGITWKQNKDKSPYWDVLMLGHRLSENSPVRIFNALTGAGDELFNFFHTIIRHANSEFGIVKEKKNNYPDTVLLRTFINLLQVQQAQLNGIAQQHLGFYYKDILKQQPRAAVSDSAFVTAALARKDAAFILPAGTLFDAGVDAQKNQVLFTTTTPVNLNPASLNSAVTISAGKTQDGFISLYLQNMPAPATLQKDTEGKILSWPTFGNGNPATGKLVEMGFALASPILLLKEGTREVVFRITFGSGFNAELLKNAGFFFSTKTAWLDVTSKVKVLDPAVGLAQAPTLTVTLDPLAPAVEPFQKNPDGFTSPWPLFKITFDKFTDPGSPPVLTGIQIDVNVSQLKTFTLSNNDGALSVKNPFQPLGASPVPGSSFIVGNAEIFSKPFRYLQFELDWNNLPAGGLQTYYSQYNNYLNPPSDKTTHLEKAYNWVKSKVGVKSSPGAPGPEPDPFTDTSFTVAFQVLSNRAWLPFSMHNDQEKGTPEENSDTSLFTVDTTSNNLSAKSLFSYGSPSQRAALFIPDPSIQVGALQYSGAATSGFLKMVLTGPVYGFGKDVYPGLVSFTAMENAASLMKNYKTYTRKDAVDAPALPFSPKVQLFTASYSASVTYMLDGNDGYPLECFSYTPFATYPVYNNTATPPLMPGNYASLPGVAVPGSILLYPGFDYDRVLLLEMDQPVPAASMNLYFELVTNDTATAPNGKTDHYYLGANGWETLPVLSNGTNNYQCTGIVRVPVPVGISNAGVFMPGSKYWISIAAKGDVSSFSRTSFYANNGFVIQRSGVFPAVNGTPVLAAGAITKTAAAVPQLSSFMQPFPSFGGRAAETGATMNQRVSLRLKTKDRAVSASDYFILVRQQFEDICYVKPVHQHKNTTVYVVKSFDNPTVAGAFTPLAGKCRTFEIQQYLSSRSMAGGTVSVADFNLEKVRVFARLRVQQGYSAAGVQTRVVQAINIFLSPWIASTQQQAPMDGIIHAVQVASLIKGIEGVKDVDDVSFQTPGQTDTAPQYQVKPANASTLLVPDVANHNIQFLPGI